MNSTLAAQSGHVNGNGAQGAFHLPLLSDAQLSHYRSEGYVVLGKIMDDATLEQLRGEEARFRGNPGPNELTIFRSQLSHYSRILREFCTSGGHLDVVKQLVGPNVCFWFNQYVSKQPDAASGKSEFPWHQDNGYNAVTPATNVTVWIALDDVNEENGCVWVVPKSHEMGLLDHSQKSADSWHLEVPVEGDGVPAILKAGEAIAFTGLTLHRSKLNYSNRIRRAFFMEYADISATFTQEGRVVPILSSFQAWPVAGQAAWPPVEHKLF